MFLVAIDRLFGIDLTSLVNHLSVLKKFANRIRTTADFWTGEGSYSVGTTTNGTGCYPDVTIYDGVNDPLLSEIAWFCGNNGSYHSEYSLGTNTVGTKLANGFGLYDMHLNVWEWTSDWYGCTYPNGGLWCGSAGSERVVRGGGWNHTAAELKSSFRTGTNPTLRTYGTGFRLRKIVQP